MRSVIIVGGGTSVKEGISKGLWENIEGCSIWSCNFAYQAMPYLPTRELWVDKPFFVNNEKELEQLAKHGVELVAITHPLYLNNKHVTIYRKTKEKTGYKGREAFNTADTPPHIFNGKLGLVGTFALSVAIAEHYDNIYLLGYDYGTPTYGEKDTHFYQDEVQLVIKGRETPVSDKRKIQSSGVGNPNVYYKGKAGLKSVSDYDVFNEKDFKVYNVSLRSNINKFDKISYDDFFKRIENEKTNDNIDG